MRECVANDRQEVAIVHRDQGALMGLTVALARNGFNVTATESTCALQGMRAAARTGPAAIVVALVGDEDFRELAGISSSQPRTKFLFLAPRACKAETLASLARWHAVTVANNEDSSAVVVATLIALLAREAIAG
jgi:DNA-binding NarL/FixJ family response regulator